MIAPQARVIAESIGCDEFPNVRSFARGGEIVGAIRDELAVFMSQMKEDMTPGVSNEGSWYDHWFKQAELLDGYVRTRLPEEATRPSDNA